MAGVIHTKQCRCCHRMMPLDQLEFHSDDLFGVQFEGWLCIDRKACVHGVENRNIAHYDIMTLGYLLADVDSWLFDPVDGSNPKCKAWDQILADLVMMRDYADPKELSDLIEKMDAKGMVLASAMLKPEED